MRPAQHELTVIDFETTGTVKGLPSEPWQIGMVAFRAGRVAPDAAFDSFLHVGDRPFSPYAPGRHALIRDQLDAAPTLPQLWPGLRSWLTDRLLVAHNIATERKCLAQAFPLHPFGPWLDTLDLVRIAYPSLATHKLEKLTEDLGLTARVTALCPDRAPHDALFDAVACAALLEHLLALPGWEDATLETLVQAKPHAYHRQRTARRNISRNDWGDTSSHT